MANAGTSYMVVVVVEVYLTCCSVCQYSVLKEEA